MFFADSPATRNWETRRTLHINIDKIHFTSALKTQANFLSTELRCKPALWVRHGTCNTLSSRSWHSNPVPFASNFTVHKLSDTREGRVVCRHATVCLRPRLALLLCSHASQPCHFGFVFFINFPASCNVRSCFSLRPSGPYFQVRLCVTLPSSTRVVMSASL